MSSLSSWNRDNNDQNLFNLTRNSNNQLSFKKKLLLSEANSSYNGYPILQINPLTEIDEEQRLNQKTIINVGAIASSSGLQKDSDKEGYYLKKASSRSDKYDSGSENNFNIVNHKQKSIDEIDQEIKQRYGKIDTGILCDRCKKTKFSDASLGHICFICQNRFCLRCSLKYQIESKAVWVCFECNYKQGNFLESIDSQFASQLLKKNLNLNSIEYSKLQNISNNNNYIIEESSGGNMRKLPSLIKSNIIMSQQSDIIFDNEQAIQDIKIVRQRTLSRQSSISGDDSYPQDTKKNYKYRASNYNDSSINIQRPSLSIAKNNNFSHLFANYQDQSDLHKGASIDYKYVEKESEQIENLPSTVQTPHMRRTVPSINNYNNTKIITSMKELSCPRNDLISSEINVKNAPKQLPRPPIKPHSIGNRENENKNQARTEKIKQVHKELEQQDVNSANLRHGVDDNANEERKLESLAGHIQLKIFYDSNESCLYVTINQIVLNKQNLQTQDYNVFNQLELENTSQSEYVQNEKIFFKIKILSTQNINDNGHLRTSQHYSHDKQGIYYVNKMFAFHSINSFEIDEYTVCIQIFDSITTKLIGETIIDLSSKVNINNELQNQAIVISDKPIIYSRDNRKPNNNELLDFSITSDGSYPINEHDIDKLNAIITSQDTFLCGETMLNIGKKRQLPQIPGLNRDKGSKPETSHVKEKSQNDLVMTEDNTIIKRSLPKLPQENKICDNDTIDNAYRKKILQESESKRSSFEEIDSYMQNNLKESHIKCLSVVSRRMKNKVPITVMRNHTQSSPELEYEQTNETNDEIINNDFPTHKVHYEEDALKEEEVESIIETRSHKKFHESVHDIEVQKQAFENTSDQTHEKLSTNLNNFKNEDSLFETNRPNISISIVGTKAEKLFSPQLLSQKNYQNQRQSNITKTVLDETSSYVNKKVTTIENETNIETTRQSQKEEFKDSSALKPELQTESQISPIKTETEVEKTGIKKAEKIDESTSELQVASVNNAPESTNLNKKRRPSMAKALVILGLSKKSNSASNLTHNKRFGFVRSEEIGVSPDLRSRNLSPTSADSSEERPKSLWSGALKLPHEKQFNVFVEGLGPGQKVSRQVLGSPCLGEIQLSLFIDKQLLNIEIIRAKNLKPKSGYRILPAAYVKLYMFKGRNCVEKKKTSLARRTLDPMYQETIKFEQNYRGNVLQVTVWGDYGKLDRKVFMGVAQIVLDELNLTSMVIGWFKLYSITSIIPDISLMINTNADSTQVDGEVNE